MNTDIFARTQIDPGTLVQKLDLDERSVASVRRGERVRVFTVPAAFELLVHVGQGKFQSPVHFKKVCINGKF